MQTLSAKDAKYGFGRLIGRARAEPVAVTKHGRPVVVVLSVEEYERLKALESASAGEKDTEFPRLRSCQPIRSADWGRFYASINGAFPKTNETIPLPLDER